MRILIHIQKPTFCLIENAEDALLSLSEGRKSNTNNFLLLFNDITFEVCSTMIDIIYLQVVWRVT
jgi:hypothetical protein